MGSAQNIDIGGLLGGGRQRLAVDVQVPLEPFEGVTFPKPARVRLEVRGFREELDIEGSIEVGMRAPCDRCLAEFGRHLRVEVEERLDASPQAQADAFGESNVLGDGRLRVADLAAQLVYGAVPLRLLCDETCKGICTVCGENKTKGACACVPDDGERE